GTPGAGRVHGDGARFGRPLLRAARGHRPGPPGPAHPRRLLQPAARRAGRDPARDRHRRRGARHPGRRREDRAVTRRAQVLGAALGALVATWLAAGSALAFTVSGRFLYEDRMWDKDGYTGQVQNLPIRHAKVEVVGLPSVTLA